MDAADLTALRGKYERMLCLRLIHARARADAGFVEPDPRSSMAELARDFPGALREIDALPIDVIRARIEALRAAEEDPANLAPWMNAQIAFHALARGALAAKRWLAGRPVTPMLEEAFVHAAASMPNAREALSWAHYLGEIGTPPRGRIMEIVYVRLAKELGTDVATARATAMPAPRCGGENR